MRVDIYLLNDDFSTAGRSYGVGDLTEERAKKLLDRLGSMVPEILEELE